VDNGKWFNRLYLHVIVEMGEVLQTTAFRDPAFITALDVAFANLYFQALARADASAAAAPAAGRMASASRAKV
jgi:hypothetical protein